MLWMKQQSRQENVIYLAMWGLLFAAPILSLYVRTLNGTSQPFLWEDVLFVWKQYTVFLLLFLIHNFLLAPLVVYRHKRVLYGSIVAVMVASFVVFQCTHRPDFPRDDNHPMERMERAERMERMEPMPPTEAMRPEMPRRHHMPPAIIGEHDVVSVIILVLMLGLNLGVKFYFKNREDRKTFIELERQNLEQQLEQLKYQLNPHFLMNTLNNIHALIEIDSQQAQDAVIQLSKILRYVLYDSNKSRVPLSQEIAFMDNYVRLMRMRYGDKLRFTASESSDYTGISIPPLLFISFVENAFKHGVSYQSDSFIELTDKRYKDKGGHERLRWTCRNSKHLKQDTTATAKQGGIGMTNVRRRLDLIFGDDYALDVNETGNTYEVTLDIPLEKV